MRPHCRRSPEPHELDGTPKADPQFRQKQSLTASVKTSEAVGQTGMPVFLAVRLLGSGCSHRGFGCERLQKAHSGLSLRSKAVTESAVLTFELPGTQHWPRSGILLCVRAERPVGGHFEAACREVKSCPSVRPSRHTLLKLTPYLASRFSSRVSNSSASACHLCGYKAR